MSNWFDYRPRRKPKALPKMHYRVGDGRAVACGADLGPPVIVVLEQVYPTGPFTTVRDQVTCGKCRRSKAFAAVDTGP